MNTLFSLTRFHFEETSRGASPQVWAVLDPLFFWASPNADHPNSDD